MKTLLKMVVGEHVLRWDEFLTILATAEATLNADPLLQWNPPQMMVLSH